MDRSQIQTLVQDGQKLAALLGPALEAQAKVAGLEKTAANLNAENARLRARDEARRENMKTAAEASADFFVDCGALKVASRQEFVDRLIDHPEVIFEVARQYGDKLASVSVGAGVAPVDLNAALSSVGATKQNSFDRWLHDDER